MYQNSSDTVKYVLTANTSQSSGLRKFGQMPIWFGSGNSQYDVPDAADVDAREDAARR